MTTIGVERTEYEYAGRQLPVLRVRIEGTLFGEEFFPFDAASKEIYRHICPECYASAGIPACGSPEFKVVQHNGQVYWLCNLEHARLQSLAAAEQYNFVFVSRYYEQQLGGSTQMLPSLLAADLELAWESIPKFPSKLGLFTLPEIEQDSQGRKMLELLAAVNFLQDAKLMNAPIQPHMFQVGIDLPGTPILELEWGRQDGCYQLRFPIKSLSGIWLRSKAIQQYGEQYLEQIFQVA
jgi:hypothetical protein